MQKKDNSQADRILTGFSSIDRAISGLYPSALTILASCPRYGKTTLALNIIRNIVIDRNIPTIYFSSKLSKEKLAKRLIILENKQFEKLKQAPLYIDDTPYISIQDLHSKTKKLVEQEGVRIIIVDYLQLIREADLPLDSESVRKITKALKDIATELNISIIALAQLYKSVSPRTEQRLQLIRNAENIGLYADIIMLLDLNRDSNGNVHDLSHRTILINKDKVWMQSNLSMLFNVPEFRFIDINET